MGHMQEARVSGYICRLCSEVSRVVILLYGEVGIKLALVAKINNFLNINVSFRWSLVTRIIYILKCLILFADKAE